MKIPLIDNGLDSLTKGYTFLQKYEAMRQEGASDASRFLVLKDAILSMQHGIEILFKFLIKEKNEVLLFSEISPKLKAAYLSRKKGEIAELFEHDGVHTVSFRESVERVNDILGIEIDERLRRTLLKIEKWRNGIIHSAVVLNENEVSNVLFDVMERLDEFFGASIGIQYRTGQGRQNLDRAYRLFKAVHGEHQNSVKAGVIARLIAALSANGIRDVTAPGVFVVRDPQKAFSILQGMVGDESHYGCDWINYHNSGDARVVEMRNRHLVIHCADINTDYRINFSGLLIFVPKVDDEMSPLAFLYSGGMDTLTDDPAVHEIENFKTQSGFFLPAANEELWSKRLCDEFYYALDDESVDVRPSYKSIVRFLSKGMVCFLNVQSLRDGTARKILYAQKHNDIDSLHAKFKEVTEK